MFANSALKNRVGGFIFFAVIFIFFYVDTGLGQVTETKQIYLWDVTGSMKKNGIWEQVKELLKKNVSGIQDKSTEVIVVPYQDDVFPEMRFKVGNPKAMSDFEEWVNGYQIPPPKNHGTNICKALERAQEFIVKEKINIVYLLTDGVHEPIRPDMKKRYPVSCLNEFICDKWCEFATQNNAFLVYYQLFGSTSGFDLKECSSRACRIDTIGPAGPKTAPPREIYSITPQITLVSKDKTFFGRGIVKIPVTTNLPKKHWGLCDIKATIASKNFSYTSAVSFNGAEFSFKLPTAILSELQAYCQPQGEYCKLEIKFSINKFKEFVAVITPNGLPMKIKNAGERWVELKVVTQ